MHTLPIEPLVSVIMGVRYRRKDLSLLERSVQSILDQTLGDFEFLICEWDSTKEAKARIERFAVEDKRIRMIEGNGADTLAAKLNRCLKQAKGRYIARMDDDDYSHADRLEKQLSFLLQNEEAAFVGCNVTLIQNGQRAGQRMLPSHPTVEDFYFTQPYIHPSLLFRREVPAAVGGYSEDKRQILCEDYDLLLRLYAKGYQGVNLQEPLLDYTVSANVKETRKMRHRLNETRTRYERFKELGRLPEALPWVVKPIVVGLLPEGLLKGLKAKYAGR